MYMPDESVVRKTTYREALLEGMRQCLHEDERVHLFGLGVPDPKGIFGTTIGLKEEFGPERVFDIPTAENGMTGVAIGSSLVGLRPVMTHQRVEFALLAVEQIVNQAAKWHYMTGGAMKVPLVIRMIVGRGWGQGPQHSQTLDVYFAHIPGLKVVAPATPADAKGLLISSIRDSNPVIFMEHRWLHETVGLVPETNFTTEIGKANIVRPGTDITLISYSYLLLEVLEAAKLLEKVGISCEVIDLRTLRPMDYESIDRSVQKTGRVLVVDNGWVEFGISAEIISHVTERNFSFLKAGPKRLGTVGVPIPSTRSLANLVYPSVEKIINLIREILPFNGLKDLTRYRCEDVPNAAFKGPF
jgi:pyruvate dehydrogenase E1 component beta subunit